MGGLPCHQRGKTLLTVLPYGRVTQTGTRIKPFELRLSDLQRSLFEQPTRRTIRIPLPQKKSTRTQMSGCLWDLRVNFVTIPLSVQAR